MGGCFLQGLGSLRISLCACLLLSLLAADSMAEVCSKLRVGGVSWPPVYQPATSGVPASGIGLKLLESIERELGVGFEFQSPQPFARELFQLLEGDLDVIIGLYPTRKRLHHYEMTVPFYREPLHAYSLEKNNLSINALSDLNGLVAVVIRGTSYGMLLDEYFASEASVIQVINAEQRIPMLLTGKADYLIHSPVSAEVDFQGRFNPEQVRMSEEPLSWEAVAMAFSRLSPCRRLVPDVNRLILEKRFGGVDS